MRGNGDYISREAANEACRAAVRRYPNSFYNGIEAARDAIRKLPAADVRPVQRGMWKLGGYGQISDATEKWYDKYLTGGFLYCSVCKGRTSVKFNFCPNCGADMREES